jgi:hypothetical protein
MTSLLPWFQALQDSSIGTSIRESVVLFPVIESIHVLALTVSVGLILITDLRLIGWCFADERASRVMGPLRPWMLAGFGAMFASGGLLFWAEAANCYNSPTFRLKMFFLALAGLNAIVFESTMGRASDRWGQLRVPPRRARTAGWLSLVCWTAVIVLGRWTAYGLN